MWRALVLFGIVVAIVYGLYHFMWNRPVGVADKNAEVVATVKAFGLAMQNVPLNADVETVRTNITVNYKQYVTKQLLADWREDPTVAPGRHAATQWPARIEPETMAINPDGSYTVQGNVIEITSKELVSGGAAKSYPVEVHVINEDGVWHINAYQETR